MQAALERRDRQILMAGIRGRNINGIGDLKDGFWAGYRDRSDGPGQTFGPLGHDVMNGGEAYSFILCQNACVRTGYGARPDDTDFNWQCCTFLSATISGWNPGTKYWSSGPA